VSNDRTSSGIRAGNPAALAWLVSGILLLGMIGLAWWATGLRNDRDDARDALATAQQELAATDGQNNALAVRLAATTNGPADASGTIFLPLSGTGVLSVVNLPPPAEGQMYQVWYFPDDSTPPSPGGVFGTASDGSGFLLIPADTGSFRGLGVSLEPVSGSSSPTTPMLLQGSVVNARG
jgi:hypothetical protein